MQNSVGLVLGLCSTLHRHMPETVKDGRTTMTTPERVQKENSNCPAGTGHKNRLGTKIHISRSTKYLSALPSTVGQR